MTYANTLKAANHVPALSTESPASSSRHASGFKSMFIGPNGLRAGWRLVIFYALVVTLLAGFVLIRTGGVEGFRQKRAHAAEITITPLLMGSVEAIAFMLVCVATFIMSKIERRKFSAYGLSARQAFGKDFWTGCLWGFGAISGTLLTMFLLHGFRITGLALHGTAIFSALFGWAIAFIFVGLFEEFLDRGYVQYTLASGIGFWPAAIASSFVFGFGHFFNAHENLFGAITAGLFGIPLCLFLRRTGNLWCAIGFHAAYDWGQTFLYGVPNSGIVPYHCLFHTTFSGPQWLTGGGVGPEGSVLTPIALLIVTVLFGWRHRENRYQELKPGS